MMSLGGVEHCDRVTTEGKPFCGDLARQGDTYWVQCVHTLTQYDGTFFCTLSTVKVSLNI